MKKKRITPFFLLNNSLSRSKYFGRIDFYLIYVLLFAILYGQQQAVRAYDAAN